jgi:hypothetical protein
MSCTDAVIFTSLHFTSIPFTSLHLFWMISTPTSLDPIYYFPNPFPKIYWISNTKFSPPIVPYLCLHLYSQSDQLPFVYKKNWYVGLNDSSTVNHMTQSESGDGIYGRGSRGVWNQVWLYWRRPAAFYRNRNWMITETQQWGRSMRMSWRSYFSCNGRGKSQNNVVQPVQKESQDKVDNILKVSVWDAYSPREDTALLT